MKCFRNLVLAGVGCITAVAIATAVNPAVAAAVTAVFVAVLVLVGLVPTVVGRRLWLLLVARHQHSAAQSVQPCWDTVREPALPSPAESRRPA